MKILGIDTSSKFLNIALSEDEDIMKEESHLVDRNQASQLTPILKEFLQKSKTPVKRIGAFVIGLGPGSFTGLRIGVSAVKGFGIATGKPCIGVASIDAIACNAVENNKDIIPIIDAKRGQVYAAIYRRKAGRVKRLSDYMLLPVAELLKKIKRNPIFLGDGVSLYRNEIEEWINQDSAKVFAESGKNKRQPAFLPEKYWYPGAGNIIRLGFSRIKKAKKPGLDKLTPLYLYPDDCQVRKP